VQTFFSVLRVVQSLKLCNDLRVVQSSITSIKCKFESKEMLQKSYLSIGFIRCYVNNLRLRIIA